MQIRQRSVRENTGLLAHDIIDNSQKFGKTKLYKAMWQADLLHYRKYGETITGQDSYVRMDNGPVPHDMYAILNELQEKKLVFERKVHLFSGYVRHEFISLEDADPASFSKEQLHSTQKAIQIISPLSAKRASSLTHDALWSSLYNGEEMSIKAAAVVPSEVTPEDIAFVQMHSERFSDAVCETSSGI